MSLEHREIMPTIVPSSSLVQNPIKLAQLTGWRAFNSAREAGKIGLEDIVATLTQSESKWRTSFDQLLLSSAIKAVKSDRISPIHIGCCDMHCCCCCCCWPNYALARVRTSLLRPTCTVGQKVRIRKKGRLVFVRTLTFFHGTESTLSPTRHYDRVTSGHKRWGLGGHFWAFCVPMVFSQKSKDSPIASH